MIRRPPRSTLDRSSAASDVYKRQVEERELYMSIHNVKDPTSISEVEKLKFDINNRLKLSLIHISEPTRPY